jgi:hypothetical protein
MRLTADANCSPPTLFSIRVQHTGLTAKWADLWWTMPEVYSTTKRFTNRCPTFPAPPVAPQREGWRLSAPADNTAAIF